MSKLSSTALAMLALAAPVAAARAALPVGNPVACASTANAPALLVRIDGFKRNSGNLRVQVYGGDPTQFVKGGRRLARIEMAVPRSGPAELCVPLPGPGRYAVAVRHDLDGDGKGGINDGGGFSRNPSISLSDALARRMPRYQDVAVAVGAQPRAVEIVLYYRQGLSVRPIARQRPASLARTLTKAAS